jgi:replication-associated recombination protein RarA
MRLYEQHRPKTLDEVIGQAKAVELCKALIARKALGGQALWISGASGTGKTTIARILAREVGGTALTITEYDASDQFDQIQVDAIGRELHFRSMFGARVWIINEAHGLRKWIIRQLLGLLERLPSDALFIFTTTVAGQKDLFDGQIDAGPLLSRCIKIALTDRDLAEPFAKQAQKIAKAAGLNGYGLPAYRKLAERCGNNLREMIQAIESGELNTQEAGDAPSGPRKAARAGATAKPSRP